MDYLDELRIGNRRCVHLSNKFRELLKQNDIIVEKGSSIIFEKQDRNICLTFITLEQKKIDMGGKSKRTRLTGEFIDEARINYNWDFYLNEPLRVALSDRFDFKKDDFLIFFIDGYRIVMEIESYGDRKSRREANS